MIEGYNHTVTERFIKYAKVHTTSDPNSTSFPSTERQKDLGKILLQELKDLGIEDAELLLQFVFVHTWTQHQMFQGKM